MTRRNFLWVGLSFIAGLVTGVFTPLRQITKQPKPPIPTASRAELGAGCAGCGGCAATCPANAVELFYPQLILHPESCIGCGNCEKVCPVGAIRVVR